MKRYLLIFLLIAMYSCNCDKDKTQQENQTTTVYYFIRHAEKDRSDPSNKDPKLTEAGEQRARKWAEIFENIAFDKIYSTSYNRTQRTAFYVSKRKNIPIETYDPNILNSDSFKENTLGNTVLVVGHSNTTPNFVNAVLGKEQFDLIDDSNNGNLYIVTVVGDQKSVQLLTIN
jgi:broad specificity phosphatase PhoE